MLEHEDYRRLLIWNIIFVWNKLTLFSDFPTTKAVVYYLFPATSLPTGPGCSKSGYANPGLARILISSFATVW